MSARRASIPIYRNPYLVKVHSSGNSEGVQLRVTRSPGPPNTEGDLTMSMPDTKSGRRIRSRVEPKQALTYKKALVLFLLLFNSPALTFLSVPIVAASVDLKAGLEPLLESSDAFCAHCKGETTRSTPGRQHLPPLSRPLLLDPRSTSMNLSVSKHTYAYLSRTAESVSMSPGGLIEAKNLYQFRIRQSNLTEVGIGTRRGVDAR